MPQSRLPQRYRMKSIIIVAVTILIGIMAPIMVIAITVMGAGIIIEIKGILRKVQLPRSLGVVAMPVSRNPRRRKLTTHNKMF
jgi:ABC-type polysaccharide/polyol phosphate export permease